MANIPEKKIVPFDASLGALLPEGAPDLQVSRLPYLRMATPTSEFMYDTNHPIHALSPKLGDFIVTIGDDEYKVYPGDKGLLFLVAMTASQWKQIDRNDNQVGQPHNTKPKDLDWVPNPDKPGKKMCIATSTGDAKTADRYDRQVLVYALIEGLYPQLMYFAKTAREFGDWIADRAARWFIDRKPAPMIGLFRLTAEWTNDEEGHHCPGLSLPSSPSSASPTVPRLLGCVVRPSSAAHSRAIPASRSRIPKLSRRTPELRFGARRNRWSRRRRRSRTVCRLSPPVRRRGATNRRLRRRLPIATTVPTTTTSAFDPPNALRVADDDSGDPRRSLLTVSQETISDAE